MFFYKSIFHLTSARYQPKGIFLVAGLPATQIENSEIMKDAKSVNKCAASVAIAKLFDNTPPIVREKKNQSSESKCQCVRRRMFFLIVRI